MSLVHTADHIAFGPETPLERSTFKPLPQRSESEPRMPAMNGRRPTQNRFATEAHRPSRSAVQLSSKAGNCSAPSLEVDSRRQQSQSSVRSSVRSESRPTNRADIPKHRRQLSSYTSSAREASPDSFTDDIKDDKSFNSIEDEPASPSDNVHVLPGTMSARNGKVKSGTRQRAVPRRQKPAKTGGWKVAVRHLFVKDPVDETALERIEGRHWADE